MVTVIRNLLAVGCGNLLLVLATLFCFSNPIHAALDRVSDFALLDSNGEFHQLSRYLHRRALVVLAFDSDCNVAVDAKLRLENLKTDYEEFEFVLLDSRGRSRQELKQQQSTLPLLEDQGKLVSEMLGITQAGEVLVLNPQRLSLYYRGDSGADLKGLLDNLMGAEPDDTVNTQVSEEGCGIDYPVSEAHRLNPPDYASEVAPIIVEKCVVCHRRDGVGPFAMDSYIMTLGWSPMIREVLLNRRMPPIQVDHYLAHSADARYLSTEERQLLVHWIDNGAFQGQNVDDPLVTAAAVNTESEWKLGSPDYVVAGPVHNIPPTGVLDYSYEIVDLPFTEDRWIRAVEYRAGDPSVLHHLMTFVVEPGEDFWGPERSQTTATRRFVAGFSPGKDNVIEFPADTAVKIPAGHKLAMQFHYVTNGQSTQDRSTMALYFSDSVPQTELFTQAVGTRFVLPAHVNEFPQQAHHLFEEAVILTAVRVRMSYRGKKMKFTIEYPDGSLQPVFSVPAYNYGWQPNYRLTTPLSIPAGSRIWIEGALDNSVSNPTNPDPSLEIAWGVESWEEMFTGYLSYYADR